jgi:DNA helicase-2/ATP-dependent DNA helicase PcrA
MNLSPQQSAVVEWVKTGKGSAFVEAVAGAGKTTTLIQLLSSTTGSVFFAAYNTKIVAEIKAKVAKFEADNDMSFGNRLRVGTFHSFGFNAWRRVHKDVKAGPEAAREKRDMTVAKLTENKVPEGLHSFILNLVSLAKNYAIGVQGVIDDESLWYAIIDHHDLASEIEDEGQIAEGVKWAIRSLKYHVALNSRIIDFDDMLHAPLVAGVRMFENDWGVIDEAQDTNKARRAMARKMLRAGGRSVWVGDRAQAIYGFSGADADAVDQIIRDFNCATLPLTVTFRCPKAVVAMAQEVVSHIQAHESAPEGVTRTIEEKNLLNETLLPTDAILCRKTKPLVETAYSLIRNKIACHVEGKDIGLGLLKLVNRYQAKSLDQLRDKLDTYAERECEKLKAKGKETQAEALMDRVETVKVIADGAKTVAELRQRISDMFYDSDSGEKEAKQKPSLTLSTCHKAKGREWPRVFVLGRNVWMPSPWARSEWSKVQELNLIYVAYTRAQQELVLINVAP